MGVSSLKVLALPGLLPKGDLADWLSDGHSLEELLGLVNETPIFDENTFRTSEPYMSGGSEETSQIRIIPSKKVPPPQEGGSQGLLEPIVPDPGAVVLLSGESSAGKTVLAYNLGHHLAEGTEICGLRPLRPVRVLYCDLENPESVHRSLVHTIGSSDNLGFVRVLPRTLNSEEGKDDFILACRQFNPEVVIIDPLPIAWPVKDENDNAEADRQMWGLKQMAVQLNCIIIALWNMGEGNVKDKFKARGATARIDRTDLALNYTELTDNSRQLKIVKSRYGTLGLGVTLRFSGDMGFEAVSNSDGIPTPSAIADLMQRIRDLLRSGRKARKELIDVLGNDDLVDKALYRLVQAGEVSKVKRGVYELLSSESPNLGEEDSEVSADDDVGFV